MRSSEIRLGKLKLRLRDKRFANHKAPCTVIWQQPLQSVLALRGCSATDLILINNCENILSERIALSRIIVIISDTKAMWLNSLWFFLWSILKSLVYVSKPRNIRDLKEEIRQLSGSLSEFHGQSSCIPALLIWSYAQHHFPYLKWEGELNMFMSFFNVFWKYKVHNLTYQNRRAFWRTLYLPSTDGYEVRCLITNKEQQHCKKCFRTNLYSLYKSVS